MITFPKAVRKDDTVALVMDVKYADMLLGILGRQVGGGHTSFLHHALTEVVPREERKQWEIRTTADHQIVSVYYIIEEGEYDPYA